MMLGCLQRRAQRGQTHHSASSSLQAENTKAHNSRRSAEPPTLVFATDTTTARVRKTLGTNYREDSLSKSSMELAIGSITCMSCLSDDDFMPSTSLWTIFGELPDTPNEHRIILPRLGASDRTHPNLSCAVSTLLRYNTDYPGSFFPEQT